VPTLSDDQQKVLAALMADRAGPAQRTEAALAERTWIAKVGRVLGELETFEPPLVQHDLDEMVDTRVWQATPAAGDLLDAQRGPHQSSSNAGSRALLSGSSGGKIEGSRRAARDRPSRVREVIG